MEGPRTTVGRTHVDSIHEMEDVTIHIAFNPYRSHGDSNPFRKMDVDDMLKRASHRRAVCRPSCHAVTWIDFDYTTRHADRQKVHKENLGAGQVAGIPWPISATITGHEPP
jgi:hypothetical protein